ncbi:cysteine--tRNA ligase [Gammaproteobacteria bacterium]|nr:cysteine--tRNA ligase [Gammaproteobacteria bacterium]MDA7802792.1 cysteine--tRNA ligase [Gammaproteobacteria bacterium]MDA8696294.1 cysteine--tRNA ligase [Gammaproteobacteria bacterium]MDA8957670.1 cysteine--tRNA ligase [Gammaproteobacteria bacterium]MDA9039170.1 cysteine--tRNA ligase [Gammaproteobacteria bacterium]
MHNLKIHNSFSGKKENFIPLDDKHIKIYACGPTVYNFAHIGNARMAVVFDTFVRVLRHTFPKVTYVSNITDIDDKIIAAAREQNLPINEITTKYTQIYNSDMKTLGVNEPDHQPKATEFIDEMIELIETLIDKGHAYEKDGHVLFHVLSYGQYGSLSKRNRDEQIAGSRVEIAPYKKDAADFVMWKPSTNDQPGWDSPWGFGRPGWHTECSAMSEKTLGLPFDIHGGGRDLVFPHHENEIAQSCCASASIDDPTSYAKYWMHNGFVTVDGEKMSKSLNNITLVKELTDKYQGEVLRLALISSHYRQGLDWNEKIIHQAEKLLNKLYKILHEGKDLLTDNSNKVDEEMLDAMSDDLNTPKAISILNSLVKEYPKLEDSQKAGCINKIKTSGQLLGILHQDPETWFSKDTSHMDIDLIEGLMKQRDEAKALKNYSEADSIRQKLTGMGVEILDSKDGSKWKPVSS